MQTLLNVSWGTEQPASPPKIYYVYFQSLCNWCSHLEIQSFKKMDTMSRAWSSQSQPWSLKSHWVSVGLSVAVWKSRSGPRPPSLLLSNSSALCSWSGHIADTGQSPALIAAATKARTGPPLLKIFSSLAGKWWPSLGIKETEIKTEGYWGITTQGLLGTENSYSEIMARQWRANAQQWRRGSPKWDALSLGDHQPHSHWSWNISSLHFLVLKKKCLNSTLCVCVFVCVLMHTCTHSCPTSCNPIDCNTPGFPVLHYLLEFAQTHVPWVGDAI